MLINSASFSVPYFQTSPSSETSAPQPGRRRLSSSCKARRHLFQDPKWLRFVARTTVRARNRDRNLDDHRGHRTRVLPGFIRRKSAVTVRGFLRPSGAEIGPWNSPLVRIRRVCWPTALRFVRKAGLMGCGCFPFWRGSEHGLPCHIIGQNMYTCIYVDIFIYRSKYKHNISTNITIHVSINVDININIYISHTHTQMDEWNPQNVKTGPLFKELAETEVQRRETCGTW